MPRRLPDICLASGFDDAENRRRRLGEECLVSDDAAS
jgi:hypothetical protein